MPLDQEESGEKEMSFLEHLEELRWHVIRALGASHHIYDRCFSDGSVDI